MTPRNHLEKELAAENAELRARLEDAEEMLRAIRAGEVDALVVESVMGPQIYVLQGLDAETARLRGDILAQVSEAVFAIDADRRVIYLNAAAEWQYGVIASQALGRNIGEIFEIRWLPSNNEAALATALHDAGFWRGENAHVKRTGETIYVESSVSVLPLEHGLSPGVLMVIRDISDRKRAEEVMRQNELLFSKILEQAPGGVYVVDDQFRTLKVNALARPTFAAAEPVIGRDFGEVMRILWGPELGPQLADIFRHTLETGERYVFPRFSHQRYDLGEQRSYAWETQRLTLPNGKFGVVCYFTDTTEQRAHEDALRNAKEAAELANRTKDRFLAVLSHELRTPLTPVILTVEALEIDPSLKPEVREDLAMIKRNIELETRLIDDLLDLSRITNGKVELKSRTVDLNEAVRHVCGICQPQLLEKDICLETTFGERVGSITADPTRLQQILWNVLKNAVKFTPARGTVRIRTRRLGPERCQVRVEDSGIGIPSDVLPRIFDAFEQGETHITRQFGGLGLGLAITRALVELQGGTIRAESVGPGQGATFTIELPSHSGTPVAAPPPYDAGGPTLGTPLRILLVEDDPDSARALGRLLRWRGFEVVIASDVAGAIAAAEREAPDLLVSDLGLPDGTGHELMLAVRAKHSMPAIAMSGYGMQEDLLRSREAGFAEHLVKPVSMTDLVAAIRRLGGKFDPKRPANPI